MWLFLVPQGCGCLLSEWKNNKGNKEKKSNGCQSEVIPLLYLLLWQTELSSLSEFVVCSEKATSFVKSSQNTSPHVIPMPYKSWSNPKYCLFPSESGILSWLGVFFLGICLREWVGQSMSTDIRTLAMSWPSSRQEGKLQPDPALVTGGLVVPLVADFCSLGQNLGSLLCFRQLSRALVEGIGGCSGAVFTCHKAATNSNCAIIDVGTSKMLRRKKARKLPGNCMKIEADEKWALKGRCSEMERVGVGFWGLLDAEMLVVEPCLTCLFLPWP